MKDIAVKTKWLKHFFQKSSRYYYYIAVSFSVSPISKAIYNFGVKNS